MTAIRTFMRGARAFRAHPLWFAYQIYMDIEIFVQWLWQRATFARWRYRRYNIRKGIF